MYHDILHSLIHLIPLPLSPSFYTSSTQNQNILPSLTLPSQAAHFYLVFILKTSVYCTVFSTWTLSSVKYGINYYYAVRYTVAVPKGAFILLVAIKNAHIVRKQNI